MWAEVLSVRHELDVSLDLEAAHLHGRDAISLQVRDTAELTLRLWPKARVIHLEIDGKPASFFREGKEGEVVRVALPQGSRSGDVRLAVEFEGVFDDPWPRNPHVFDNPGYDVAATITPSGAFFLAGSGWYPQLEAPQRSILLTVRAPQGIYAVTSGALISHDNLDGASISKWICSNSPNEIDLFAGPYIMDSRRAGSVPIQTYFFQDNAHLAPRYLEAAARHIRDLSRLHGPYAFPKFAVVENFFPTGYGFPSYTLLGSQVLRLPFILETSLRHEIAHCWWGNGVLVDFSGGNWSEGLTTYVADYLAKERASAQEAAQYRRQILRDYAQLAAGRGDLPVRRFMSRQSPASQVVGYGKAMFVFHMARRTLDGGGFWNGLRDVYKQRLFQPATWEHFQHAFVAQGWSPAEAQIFFEQWLDRTGAPRLRLGQVRLERLGASWVVHGELLQDKPHYDLRVPIWVRTAGFSETRIVRLNGQRAPFSFTLSDRPLAVEVDPEAHVFRLLSPEEIPVTVNSLKVADRLAVVFSSSLGETYRPILRMLLESLGQSKAEILREEQLDPAGLAGRNVLFFGFPATEKGQKATASVQSSKWLVLDQLSQQEALDMASSDVQFAVYPDPERPDRIVAFLVPRHPTDMAAVEESARKITHYGKYSYLGFEKGANTVKGVWEPQESPLIVDLDGT